MSVILNFDICETGTCDSLSFVETTGAYSLTNTGGWGSPNQATSDALTAVLTIVNPSGNSTTINLYSTYPTIDDDLEHTIAPEDIGLATGSKFTNGIYNFTYTVTTSTTTYTQNFQKAFYCQVQCCVLSMFVDIDIECDCSKDKIDNALKAYILLKGLIYSGNCGNKTNFNNILAQLQKICLNNNCNNCK